MSDPKQFRLMTAGIPQGVSEYDFSLDADFFRLMGNTDIIGAAIKAHLRLDHKNEVYYCHFTLQGTLTLPCDRCLEPVDHPVDTCYEVTVKYGPEFDDSTEALLIIPESDPYIDVAPLLYDTAILTIPMRLVHPEGECDPRVEEMLGFEDDESAEEDD